MNLDKENTIYIDGRIQQNTTEFVSYVTINKIKWKKKRNVGKKIFSAETGSRGMILRTPKRLSPLYSPEKEEKVGGKKSYYKQRLFFGKNL